MTISGEEAGIPEHIGDVLRLEILAEHGGIYTDLDVIIVNSVDSLRHHSALIGRESLIQVNSGIILSEPNGTFVRLWLDSYSSDYEASRATYNSGVVPLRLSRDYPDSVIVDDTYLFSPGFHNTSILTEGNIPWKHLCAIHIMHEGNYTPETIKHRNFTVEQVLSYAYSLRNNSYLNTK